MQEHSLIEPHQLQPNVKVRVIESILCFGHKYANR